jgi:hypothetical protein
MAGCTHGGLYAVAVVDADADRLLERLIEALAAQAGASAAPALAPGAVAALSDLSRAEAMLVFGHAGHLVHYGSNPMIELQVKPVSSAAACPS